MRSGMQGVGKVRTGAKTASKDQERDFLERFARLAEDPSPLVPRWAGPGTDPLAGVRSRLAKVAAKRGKTAWLRWYGRGKSLRAAYAQTLLVLEGGKIPSFASMKFRGRDVKYVLRGNGLQQQLLAVQNHEEADARLLGYVKVAKRHRVVLVSLDDDFAAYPVGGPVPAEVVAALVAEAGFPARAEGHRVACAHALEGRAGLRYELPQLGAAAELCRACVKKLDQGLGHMLEAHVLTPTAKITAERRAAGSDRVVHPESRRAEFDALLGQASKDALRKAEEYTDVRDEDLLDWSEEAFQTRLDERGGGFLLLDRDLWLDDFEAAALEYGSTDLEKTALRLAFQRAPPRVRTSDPSLQRLLEPPWPEHGRTILGELAKGRIDPVELDELAKQRPPEALAALQRRLALEERTAEYPRFDALPAPLRLAHDLFKAHKAGDTAHFQRRLSEGVRDPATKPVALALARAFNQSAGIEWQYAPHEKDQALFFQPAAKRFVLASPATYTADLAVLAQALEVAAPSPRREG